MAWSSSSTSISSSPPALAVVSVPTSAACRARVEVWVGSRASDSDTARVRDCTAP